MEHPDSGPTDGPNDISVLRDLEFELLCSKGNTKLLNYAINHIFVPLKLPNRADGTPRLEAALLRLVRDLVWPSPVVSSPRVLPMPNGRLYEDELTENSIETALAPVELGGSILFNGNQWIF